VSTRFVRSYEWYLLPENERRKMLADHGKKRAITGRPRQHGSRRSRSFSGSRYHS